MLSNNNFKTADYCNSYGYCFLNLNPINPHFLVNIGEFSLDVSRNLQLGRSQVRYLNEAVIDKKMSTNLANGIENFVQKDRDEGIDQILRWINRMAAPNSSLKKVYGIRV